MLDFRTAIVGNVRVLWVSWATMKDAMGGGLELPVKESGWDNGNHIDNDNGNRISDDRESNLDAIGGADEDVDDSEDATNRTGSYGRNKKKYSQLRDHDFDSDSSSAVMKGPSSPPRTKRSTKIFVLGPHWFCILVTIATIVGGNWLANNILSNKLHYFSNDAKLAMRVFVNVMCAAALAFLFLTATSDSGIVNLKQRVLNSSSSSSLSNYSYSDADVRASDRHIRDRTWCKICKQPTFFECGEYNESAKVVGRGTYHCHDCDVCVAGHDHHCPWMGQCIGKCNMKWFILFNISWVLAFLELLVLAFII